MRHAAGRQAEQQPAPLDRDNHERSPLPERDRRFDDNARARPEAAGAEQAAAQRPDEDQQQPDDDDQAAQRAEHQTRRHNPLVPVPDGDAMAVRRTAMLSSMTTASPT